MFNRYFDYAATTPVREEVLSTYFSSVEKDWQNPSAAYSLKINRELNEIKETLSAWLQLSGKGKVIFTSGATESINTVLVGKALKNKKGKIIISNMEHNAVTNTALFVQNQFNHEIVQVPGDERGFVHPDGVDEKLNAETTMISIIGVQNELGTIQPVKEIYQRVKSFSEKITVHIDGAQCLGKIPFKEFIPYGDMFSFSGHKFYGPKGIGLLAVKDASDLIPLIHGGGQQDNMRSGTVNYPLIKAFFNSFEIMKKNFESEFKQVLSLKKYFVEQLASLDNFIINTPEEHSVPHIVNFSCPGLKGEPLRNFLNQNNIYISSGSACSTHLAKKNILLKMNRPKEIADSALRLSLSHLTKKREIDFLIEKLIEAVDFFKI